MHVAFYKPIVKPLIRLDDIHADLSLAGYTCHSAWYCYDAVNVSPWRLGGPRGRVGKVAEFQRS